MLFGSELCWGLADADDVVLLAPTPSAMRKLLQICDAYAAEFDISFNPEKSKCLVSPAHKRRHLYRAMCNCLFFIGDKKLENVDNFYHLGHIITASLDDIDDIRQKRNCFVLQGQNSYVGQTNKQTMFYATLIN